MNKIKSLSLFSAIALAALSGCKKDDLTSDFKTSDPIQNGTAKIRFIHVAPELGGVSVKYNELLIYNSIGCKASDAAKINNPIPIPKL